jgi:hypothetical protein
VYRAAPPCLADAEDLERRDIVLVPARVEQDLRNDPAAAGFFDRVGEDHVFPTLHTVVAAYLRQYAERHGHAPPGVVVPPPPPSPLDGPGQ